MELPVLEDRTVTIRIRMVDDVEPAVWDPPDAYPRTVYVDRCRFTLWKDRIEGEVSRKMWTAGVVVAWLWGGLPIICAPDGWECVHAAAVDTDNGIVLIAGAHDTGKTTTALDLIAGGGRMFSDDRVLVNRYGMARAWSTLLHADPRTAQALTGEVHTLDAFGKVWVPPPATSERNEGRLLTVYSTGGERPLWDDGPGWDSAWVNRYGFGEQLLAHAQPAPSYRLEGVRVALTNRNPRIGPYAWDGGDMSEIHGWVEGLRANGIDAAFVPVDELKEDEWDLIHLWHAQFPWSHEVAKATKKPLVVTAITQGNPPAKEVAAAVKRASAVLCYSSLERDWYQERFPELNGRFRIMPQGVTARLYEDEGMLEPTKTFVFQAGRYSPTKNQLGTLEACKTLDVPVVFAGCCDAGSGEYLAELRRAAGNWKGMRFFGLLKGKTLYDKFRAAHVHCQPSTWETCGVSTLEALAFSANIVYTSRGFGPPVYAPYGTICDPDPNSVREAIARELSLPRGHHRFRPPIWQRAVRVAIPWYREALGI